MYLAEAPLSLFVAICDLFNLIFPVGKENQMTLHRLKQQGGTKNEIAIGKANDQSD
jgi:hypothetical protein